MKESEGLVIRTKKKVGETIRIGTTEAKVYKIVIDVIRDNFVDINYRCKIEWQNRWVTVNDEDLDYDAPEK